MWWAHDHLASGCGFNSTSSQTSSQTSGEGCAPTFFPWRWWRWPPSNQSPHGWRKTSIRVWGKY
jgi:hypothetical protein